MTVDPIRNGYGSSLRLTSGRENDAGAQFVLESKGQWWHAGYHLTTAIVGPTILTLPYVFRGLGWGLGFFCLTMMGIVTFYAYYLMSLITYSSIMPNGTLKLYHLIAMVTVVMIALSQFPSFHSLRHINLVSLLLSLGYTFLIVAACIHAATSKNAPPRDYSLESSQAARVFNAFTSTSIIAAIFGNGILPEIQQLITYILQATLAPPATGKMLKGLFLCYSVIFITFYSAAVSGYYTFGNKSNSNILQSLLPDKGSALAPTWILILSMKSADTKRGIFSKRNLIPRLILRTTYMIFCGLFAAMLPFFGDINSVIGAIGFIPLDFILPMLLYNMTYKPSKSSITYWINISIIVIFTGVGLLGTFSSIRKLILDAKEFKIFNSNVVG
ncbi:hypothetical protein Cgig2_026960 [Carnegiea gigantea]|uniref:Amino acid transporter transmembrane domain-containing protein n=1 Tax=Carnegiea gigantea TaxID=171969 RepID=A0A9Q1KUI1_9CARY|nr:hypothetical protein Cgig2_026960 [Carnegiea gigantea]